MRKQTGTILALSAAPLLVAAGASADVILCPDSTADAVLVLDPATGDQIGSFDISSVASTPIECVDGPDGTLLFSDQLADMVFQLDADGSNPTPFLNVGIDNIRGIEWLDRGFLVVSSADALTVVNAAGDATSIVKPGDYFDADGSYPGFILANEIANDNTEGWSTATYEKVGETPLGSSNFPEQVTRITTPNGERIAVCTFSDSNVDVVFPQDGSLDYSFPLNSLSRGIIQLDNGNLLTTSGSGIDEWTVDGTFVRTVVTGGSYRFLSRSSNYVQ